VSLYIGLRQIKGNVEGWLRNKSKQVKVSYMYTEPVYSTLALTRLHHICNWMKTINANYKCKVSFCCSIT